MVKKILIVGLFTGIAHFLSFFGLSYAIGMNADKIFVSKIAEIESGIALMLAIMSFGLQQIATRDIAISTKWRNVLVLTQENRVSMGIFLSLIAGLFFFLTRDDYYIIFFLAPLIALNVDYALYGRGLSVKASFLSLIKVAVPAIALIILAYINVFNWNLYFVAVIISWAIIGFFSNKILQVFVLVKPTIFFLKSYIKNIKIGLTDIALTMLKLGILALANPLYEETNIANAFVVLKLYVLVKGIQRVVFQAFYRDLVNLKKAFFIDRIGLIVGLSFFVVTLLYSNELIVLIFSQEYLITKPLFILIGIAMLVSSISITASPRMLLIKKEKAYIKSYLYALAGAVLFLLIISQTKFYFYGIIGAVLFGELILNTLFFITIWTDIFTKKRILFILEQIGLLICFICSYYLFETSVSLLVSMSILVAYGVYFIIRNKEFI